MLFYGTMSNFYSRYLAFGGKDYTAKRISVPNKSTFKNEANQIKMRTEKLKLKCHLCNFITIRQRIYKSYTNFYLYHKRALS
jgi:hypothetical protein